MTGTYVKNSAGMEETIAKIAANGGKILRRPGGYWRPPGIEGWHVGTPTVEALARRGVLRVTRTAKSYNREFPVEYELVTAS